MERVMHFEQFYYTNYNQGMRFEGNSTGQTKVASDMELLAQNWMNRDLHEPVEMVLYNGRLGCYVSAMTVPCTRTGDARTSYWIHAVMPKDRETDGFMECLSWPLQNYQTEVCLGQHLQPATVKVQPMNPAEICRKYSLTGERLKQLIYMVWQTVCNGAAPSSLCFVMGKDVTDYHTAAREIMTVVYHLLPEPYRKYADYQSKAGSDIEDVRFFFRRESSQSWQFPVMEAAGEEKIAGAGRIFIPEEERKVISRMADLYEQGTDSYERMLTQLCTDTADDYNAIMWNYYQLCVSRGQQLPFSQETLVRIQPFLEEQMKHDEGKRALLCQCLNQIDTEDEPRSFVQTVMETLMVAASELSQRDSFVYRDSLYKSWQLLEVLSDGNMKVVEDYLGWIRNISRSYYEDFRDLGLREGKISRINAEKEKIQSISEENVQEPEIDKNKGNKIRKIRMKEQYKRHYYEALLMAGCIGFLAGLLAAWLMSCIF